MLRTQVPVPGDQGLVIGDTGLTTSKTLGVLIICSLGHRGSFWPQGEVGGLWAAEPYSSRLRFWVGCMNGGWRVLWLSNVDV